jgi:hypothetical protein
MKVNIKTVQLVLKKFNSMREDIVNELPKVKEEMAVIVV